MFSPVRAMAALDSLDPRLNPVPDGTPVSAKDITKQRIRQCHLILTILDRKEDNPIRRKAKDILLKLDELRTKDKESCQKRN